MSKTIRDILILLSLWIIAVHIFAWVAFNRLYITEPDKAQYTGRGSWPKQHKLDFLEMHERGDGAWYISIARNGYSFSKDSQSNVNFFPLYPIFIKTVREIISPFASNWYNMKIYYQYVLSGTLISITALFVAIVFLYKLLLLDFNKEVVSRTIFYLLIFPTAFAFTVVYSESFFLALSVLSFYSARKHHWLDSGIFGGLATLTRPVGILLIFPLLVEFLRQTKKNEKEAELGSIIFLLLIPAGLGLFMIYLAKTFNDPLAFAHAAQAWGREMHWSVNPITSLFNIIKSLQSQIGYNLDFTPASRMNIFIEIVYLLFGLILSIAVMKIIRFSYGLYALLGVLMPVSTGVLVGQGRYLLSLFPLFIPLALLGLKREIFHQIYTITSLLFLGFHIVLFVNSYLTY